MKVFLLLSFVVASLALAPLYTHEETEPDSYIIKLSADGPRFEHQAEVMSWLESRGISVRKLTLWKNMGMFGIVADKEMIPKVRELVGIDFVEEDMIVHLPPFEIGEVENVSTAAGTPAGDWGQSRVDSRKATNPATFDPCDAGAAVDCGGSQAYIYIVDTGVRRDHVAFGGRVTLGADYAAGNAEQYNGDCNGHGTHCAGSAAGAAASSGSFSDGTKTQFGVANLAKIISVRVLNCQGSGSTSNVISGYEFVVSDSKKHPNAKNILSASLGGSYSATMNNAVTSATDAGVIVVVAAGNDNKDACDYSPASAPSAITIGATTSSDARSSFSNYGKCVNVFAPGSNIKSAWYTSANALNTISGTSMATPLAAGSIAYLPKTYSPKDVASLISQYATPNVVSNAGTGSPNLLIYDRWSA